MQFYTRKDFIMQPNYPPQDPNLGQPPPGYPQNPNQFPQQGQNYPQQQPPKKKPGIFKIGCGVLVGIVVLIVAISIAANGGKSTPSTSSSQPQSAPTQAPSKPTSWQTTHTYNGSGAKKTETIAVPSDWKIQWSCDPTSFDGMNYNVIIGVYNSDGTVADPAAINDMCKSGNTSGSTEERQSGNVYLDVNSEGSWTITIQELK